MSDEKPTLHRWTNRGDGWEEEWVCAAYDHGPFCRLCQQVDEATRLCLEHVENGLMEIVGQRNDGSGLELRLTDAGRLRADHLLGMTEKN